MKKTKDDFEESLSSHIGIMADRQDDLRMEVENMTEEISKLDLAIDSAIKLLKNHKSNGSKKSTQFTTMYSASRSGNENFNNYNGTDFFLFGLKKLGKKEATVSEITEEVAKIDTDIINKRKKDGSLKQWMMVSGDSLNKKKQVQKYKNDDEHDENSRTNKRKGGVMFKLL
jgi:hypothetical protein